MMAGAAAPATRDVAAFAKSGCTENSRTAGRTGYQGPVIRGNSGSTSACETLVAADADEYQSHLSAITPRTPNVS
jgi:hypothetical protein